MAEPSIEARGLTKRFGSFTAVDNLSIKLEGAKCVGFLGPNGAGKTTTLKMITNMIFPTAGECFINGQSAQENRKWALAHAGVLIESPEIYPSLTPREALEMVADMRGIPRNEWRSRIDEVIAEVKMSDWVDRKVGRFSKGMKQRINIAATLVHDPEVLILDEPATGLDPRGMAEVRAIVRGLKKRSRLIFMSSHILQEVTDVCDEVALINQGKLLFYDTLDNITAKFARGQTTVDVTFARPLPVAGEKTPIDTLSGVIKVDLLDPKRVRIRFGEGPGVREKLVKELVNLDLGLMSFQDSESALEDIYLSQIAKGD
jgi:ABC-2 type transport system ATP-binding protein